MEHFDEKRNQIQKDKVLAIMAEKDPKKQSKMQRELEKWISKGRPIIIKGI